MTTDNIKQKAREMFDEKFGQFYYLGMTGLTFSDIHIKSFIDTIIDQAIKERDEEIVEMIKGCPDFADSGDTLKSRIIHLIKSSK